MDRLSYVGRRLLQLIPVAFGCTLVVFFMVHLIPGDPARTMLGPRATPEGVARLHREWGLDQPLVKQYLSFLNRLIHGDLGTSLFYGLEVRTLILDRLGPTLWLMGIAAFLAVLIAVPLGIVSAVKRNGVWDHVARVFSVATLSIPVFWLGLLAIYVFFYKLGWVAPPVGRLPVDAVPPPERTHLITVDALLARDFGTFAYAWRSLALPVVVLALSLVAPITRITRAAMIEALQEDYVTFARAIGVPWREVVLRDAFRGSQVAVLTMIGFTVGYLIAGNALVEIVFSWPGIGQYAVDAVVTSDSSPVQAVLLIVAFGVAITNLLVDVSYALIDPRIRHGLTGTS